MAACHDIIPQIQQNSHGLADDRLANRSMSGADKAHWTRRDIGSRHCKRSEAIQYRRALPPLDCVVADAACNDGWGRTRS